MRSKEIFERGYYDDEDEMMFSDSDFDDMELEDYDDLVYNPTHVNIPDETVVNLVQNAQIIETLPWGEMLQFINENWNRMNGTYYISYEGGVLHSFSASS